MALGKTSVNNLNQGQGAVTAVERYFLFIGPGAKSQGQIIPINAQTDLGVTLGLPPSDLKTQVTAAQLNGGENWACLAAPLAADGDWQEALDQAMRNYSVEAVVITKSVTTAAELTAMHNAAIALQNSSGRRLFVMATVVGIDAANQTWAQYLVAQRALLNGVSAPRVMLVPQLHGSNVGVLAGRLANASVSVADTPMRVATGAVLGLGTVPVDSEGVPLDMATLGELDRARLSVPQTYPDYVGTFWGDGNMLDAEDSDFKVIEYLRIVDKAARAVRPLLIRRVGDRRLNSSANSMAVNTSALMAPLRAMAKSTTFAGQVFPGEIEPPVDGDIVLTWKSKTEVEAFMKLRPLNCPKALTANIALDLSTPNQE
ncbi:tail sheath [Pseudomonas sp. StFLB209]|uniref:DUF2586 domain-containing protein n=1 Tax=Pseudomonas sp. StFLB209 TaxID=1028989 RepID=UPI0004F91D85|nr:DUF2586 domain-containing protein [Pseudomonas sp. StFLB209]BAP41301.1 tail sheath [Pseudomonas sp. StFLB209]